MPAITEELRATFQRFVGLTQEALRSDALPIRRGNLQLVRSSPASLSERVESLEESGEFQALYKSVEAHLNGIGFGSHGWKGAVGNWLRRSGLYHRVSVGEALASIDELLGGFLAELSRRESTVTHLALLEHVSFKKQRLEFERYEIVRFTKEELERLLETQVRADFFPWATLPTRELARYWWLVIREKASTDAIGSPGKISFSLKDLDIVPRYYTELPQAVESVVQELALFKWRPLWATEEDPSWRPCRIPLCLRLNDHKPTPVSGPRADISMLDTQPEFDPYTNEEVGEEPLILFSFSAREAESFETFLRREGTLLHRALKTAWSKPLAETASSFFAKAFVADGVEQLLWHITTIEALLGEPGGGSTERLARRLAAALGTSDADRTAIRGTFEELYGFRSELVHGRTPKKDVLTRHLYEAREFARNLLRWYLRLLEHVQKAADAAGVLGDMPDRRDILRLLDLGGDGLRKARWLLPSLPSTFPQYPDLVD